MNAADVRDALRTRWPDGEYVIVEEAPDSADRQGRKIDLLAISCWRSRGLSIDAVEIKVSMSDWKRELDNPAKADFWWAHCNRFWIAAPAKEATRIKDQLPQAWGLISVADDKSTRVAVQAPKHDPEPLSWLAMVGVLRAAQNAGVGAIQRAEARGRERGYAEGKRQGSGERLREIHDELLAKVTAFEELTGLSIASRPDVHAFGYASLEDFRDAVALVLRDRDAGERARRQMAESARLLRVAADRLDQILTPESVAAERA